MLNETVLAWVTPAHRVGDAHATAMSGSGTYWMVSTCSRFGRTNHAIMPPPGPLPAATQVDAVVHATASGRATDVAKRVQLAPRLRDCRTSAAPTRGRAAAKHHDGPHDTALKTCRPFGRAASDHFAPPSLVRAASAPVGPVPTATHARGVAHEIAVAVESAAGNVDSCRHDEPLVVDSKTAVSIDVVTSARQRPGAGHASAATPDPGSLADSTAATRLAGFTISRSEPEASEPPSRQPDAQQLAAVKVASLSGGAVTLAQPRCPPAEISTDALPTEDEVGFVPAAMHHSSGSHATTESVMSGSSAGRPRASGSGGGEEVVIAQPPSRSAMAEARTARRSATRRW